MAEPARVDRSVLTVADSFEEADAADRAFWGAQTPEKRLQTTQYLREVNYGDAAPARLQRVFEFGERGPDGRYRRTDGSFALCDGVAEIHTTESSPRSWLAEDVRRTTQRL